ncbi:IclR family transcriptional regulator [Frankia sp. AgB1.9]|uniref:IclR family transcriptional regulator n=1 Tax=unclassified Frankia TaxID=2632575 RepID=UPI0019325E2E|nr:MULTISPECIES: IclR family transcriptional regulator [unclassified Frankia]MBL7487663.1 IclR family transcriptional regulator [Frankia sp. AgW1.1]MBL7550041.1 IclR family transcriptional regulator [Frankia sp. AgB1.9]MBL7621894.1 IclR family transcriptional regulator [Frankia sp. AgB1.8]
MAGTSAQKGADRTAVDKAMSLLAALGGESPAGVGVTELARRTGLTKSTAFRLLAVLGRNGVIERVGSDYRLSPSLLELGGRADDPRHERLSTVLTPFLADLYELTHETVHLAVLHGTEVLYINKLYGHRPVRSPSRIGGRVPAHCTAVGKSLLAYDATAIDAVARHGLTGLTDHTITDRDLLERHLCDVQREGIAFDHEEALAGLTCVASPVFGPTGRPVAALSVAGATGRFQPQQHAAALRRVCYAAGRALVTAQGPYRAASAPARAAS